MRVLAPAGFGGLLLFGTLVYGLDAALGFSLTWTFLPVGLLAATGFFFLRGRLGGRYVLRALREHPEEAYAEIFSTARKELILDLPTYQTYQWFGPDALTKHELARYARKAELAETRRRTANQRTKAATPSEPVKAAEQLQEDPSLRQPPVYRYTRIRFSLPAALKQFVLAGLGTAFAWVATESSSYSRGYSHFSA